MANEEQLAILKRGVDVWNAWRAGHTSETIDLRNENLSRACLNGANLHQANLRGADLRLAQLDGADLTGARLGWAEVRGADLDRAELRGADLREANLYAANLRRANLCAASLYRTNLREADLREANIRGVNLEQANLRGANLSEANLERTNLRGTNLYKVDLYRTSLRGVDLYGAFLSQTMFGDTDLSSAKGLDACQHVGPSMLDYHTLAKSGPLPLIFLRGAGLPDQLINYLPSLLSQAIQFYACFISYSSQDEGFAERLYADLQNKGVRCWYAPEDLKIGERIRVGIDEAIRVHDKLLLILSEHSVASQWVEQEVETALRRERESGKTVLFPIRIDDAVMQARAGWATYVQTRNIGDMRAWKDHDAYQRAFERLLRDLRAEGAAPGPASQPG